MHRLKHLKYPAHCRLIGQFLYLIFHLLVGIAILNNFLCIGGIGVLIDFGETKFMFLGEKLKQKFDDFKRLT